MKYFCSWMTTFIICLALSTTAGQSIPIALKALLFTTLAVSMFVTTLCVIDRIGIPNIARIQSVLHMIAAYLQLAMSIEAFVKYLK